MLPISSFGGVAECYAFKSRLQEYAQKVGLPTPVYETVMEGPSHEPVFQSSVIVNNITYNSLPGFYNRKTAEQSAAEIALIEINKAGKMTECIPTVHETGLCKNLLQEYAQKMNYAIPSYICKKVSSDKALYSCTVEIGGIRYIGAAAKTKKEAEIKAARTALLAIQIGSYDNGINGVSGFTVVPGKRKGKEPESQHENVKNIKPKRADFKKKASKRKFSRNKSERAQFKKDAQQITTKAGASDVPSEDAKMLKADETLHFTNIEPSKDHLIESKEVGESVGLNELVGPQSYGKNGHSQETQEKHFDDVECYDRSCESYSNNLEIDNKDRCNLRPVVENSFKGQNESACATESTISPPFTVGFNSDAHVLGSEGTDIALIDGDLITKQIDGSSESIQD